MAPVAFRRYRPLPPTIDRQLFSYFFGPKGPERYAFWRDDQADYQLRVFGGPGTGKTTLAALIVEDLRRVFPGATIVSVFLEEQNTGEGDADADSAFIQRFQAEVLDQTRDDAGGNPRFLIVDDIDILWETSTTYYALEAELREFRRDGWRVAATTRVLYPLRKDANMNWWTPLCDNSKHEGAESLDDDIWWICEPCQGSEQFICGRCRSRGYGCVDVHEHGAEYFIQPYAAYGLETLEVVICDVSSEMAGFIGRELQREHGNLGLDATSPQSCPPLSPLGRSLLATGRAQELLSELVTRAGGNILLALLRLDHTRAHSSAEEAIPATDRIPTEILAAFKAAVTRVCASSQGGLGLDAVKLVAAARDQDMEWKKLHSLLVARGWSSRLAPEEVVAASGGLLKTRHDNNEYVRCYHMLFRDFVRDGYDERLRLKGGQSTVPEGEHVGTMGVSFQRFWRDAVRHYTCCNLTNVEDRLVAIWGIAKVMREELEEEYAEGLWEDRLCEQLAWQVVHSPDRVAAKAMDLGPTWSWVWTIATIELLNPFEFNDSTRRAMNHTGEPLQLDLEPSSRGCLMGEDHPVLKTRRIAIRGALVPAYMVETREPGSWGISLPGPDTPAIQAVAFPDVLPEGKKQECLLLTLAVTKVVKDDSCWVVGLVLDQNSPSPGEYRRLGLFRFTFRDSEAHARVKVGAGHQEENIWLV